MPRLPRPTFASRITATAAAVLGSTALLLLPALAPAASAQMWSPPDGLMNILVVGCTFANDPPPLPGTLPTGNDFATLLTGALPDASPTTPVTDIVNLATADTPPNLSSYLAEVSYGAIKGVTSTFSGWNAMPKDFDTYKADLAITDDEQDNDCAGTAQAAGYALERYSAVVMLYSRDTGLSEAYMVGTNRIRLRPGNPKTGKGGGHSAWTALAAWAHEIGHHFGFLHSCTQISPATPTADGTQTALGACQSTYSNPFDEMSGLQDSAKSHWYFDDTVTGWCLVDQCWSSLNTIQSVPVHYAAYQKYLLGWLGQRVRTFQGGDETFFIDRLALPREATGHSTLMVKIPVPGASYYYTLETRRKVSYDAGLKTNEGIVIHQVASNPDPNADQSAELIVQNLYSTDSPNDGPSVAASQAAFQVGETALLENGTIKVQVIEHLDSDNDGDGYRVMVSGPLAAQATFATQGDVFGLQGAWRSAYGTRGAWVQGDRNNQGLTVTGAKPVVWLASTTDPRALQKSSPATDRVAGAWTGDQFSFNLDLLGPNTVSLYAVDWDSQNLRKERIDIVDRISGKVLDSETVSNFARGTYLTWTLSGHLQVRVVSLNRSWTAAVSGVFLDPPAAP